MTRTDAIRLLEPLNLRGNHVVVHASLESFGAIDGSARSVCEALVEVVGEGGTVVMPAFTYAETLNAVVTGISRPRPVAFHPELPVSREVGKIAETFRHLPGVLRSSHPTHSFAAWGRQAREVLSTQRDNNPLGPLKKLNVVQGQVLLLGEGLPAVTAIHLAEERASLPYLGRCTAVRLNAAGYDERVVLENVPGCSAAFAKLEDRIDPSKVRVAPMPSGTAHKIPIRYLVNLATAMLEADARVFICDDPGCASCGAKRDAVGSINTSAVG